MNDEVDALDADTDGRSAEERLSAISDLRRKCLALKRHLSPQQDALIKVSRSAPPWFSDANKAMLRETVDQIHRYLEDIDVVKESALVIQDDLNARATAQTNRTSYLLSIVATIFLPLGVIPGVFATGLAGTPGTQDPVSWWIMVAAMAALVAAQLAAFKAAKWI